MVKAPISRPFATDHAECSVIRPNTVASPVESPAGTAPTALLRPSTLLGGFGCALSVLALGGVLAGAAGLTISAMFCLAVIPVVGFTRSQLLLASRGRDLSRNAEDVRLLMGIGIWAGPHLPHAPTAWAEPAVHGPISVPHPCGELRGAPPHAADPNGTDPDGADPHRADPYSADPYSAHQHRAHPRTARPTRPIAAFWDVLQHEDRERLSRIACGRTATFAPGEVIFSEDEAAGHVLLLRSGRVKICLRRPGGERILALRGPGDLVGERAALEVSRRSATVEALDTVHAWMLPTGIFRAFLDGRPHVIRLIEDQIYGRLTEEGPAGDPAEGPSAEGPADSPTPPGRSHRPWHTPEHRSGGSAPAWTGQNCTIVYTDIASFSAWHRTDEDRRVVRRVMYELVQWACEESAVPWTACHREDRGDGTLLVIPPEVPTGHAIDPLLTTLAGGLWRHNRSATEAVRLQLRLALHVGPVVSDIGGVTGHSIIHTARLLDSPVLKKELSRTGADLGFITSPFVFEGSIRHGSSRPGVADFREVAFRVKETSGSAWMWLPEGAS